jgi:hypothetical protein
MIRRLWRWLVDPHRSWTWRDWVLVVVVAAGVIFAITVWPYAIDVTTAGRPPREPTYPESPP